MTILWFFFNAELACPSLVCDSINALALGYKQTQVESCLPVYWTVLETVQTQMARRYMETSFVLGFGAWRWGRHWVSHEPSTKCCRWAEKALSLNSLFPPPPPKIYTTLKWQVVCQILCETCLPRELSNSLLVHALILSSVKQKPRHTRQKVQQTQCMPNIMGLLPAQLCPHPYHSPLEERVLKSLLLPWKLLLSGQEAELNRCARAKSVIWKTDTCRN